MAIVLARLKVADYDKWRTVYDEHASMRQSSGCTGTHVFRNASDPNEVTLNLQWDTIENAQKFFTSDELRQAMQRAGVIGQPDVWFVEDAGRTAS